MEKKFAVTMLSCLSVCASLFAQTGKEWDQPAITNVNREQAHTVSIPVETEPDVTKNDMTTSPYYQSLDGTWKFLWVKTPTLARETYCTKDYNDASWSNIDVPSSWQVYGLHHKKSWDKPLYCNVAYPFSFNESTYSVMADRPSWFMYNSNMPNPVGTYRRKFTIPSTWAGRDIYVRFNGVGHGYYLWINGHRIGYSEDSYLPSEFNNNINTFWHTEYWGTEPTCPHTLVVDMVKTYLVTHFTYTARTDGNSNGMVKEYEVYLSKDGKLWGTPVASGEFKNTTSMQVAALKEPTSGRYSQVRCQVGNQWKRLGFSF